MLSLISKIFKVTLFALVVIVLANVFYWDGKSISDQVKHSLAQAKRVNLGGTLKDWSEGAKKTFKRGSLNIPSSVGTGEIQTSEREKLRALIRDLNTSPAPSQED